MVAVVKRQRSVEGRCNVSSAVSGEVATRRIKAKILSNQDDSRWKVRLNPDTADLEHPGNTLWFLEFDRDAIVGSVTPPGQQSDLGRSTFDLKVDAPVKECRMTTVQEFFDRGSKFEPGAGRDNNTLNPNGTIGDPTSRSNLC